MAVHLIGSGSRGIFDVASTCSFSATLRVAGALSPSGDFATARIACPRKGCVDGSDCLACEHLQAFGVTPSVRLYCASSDEDLVADWMRRRPPTTSIEARCYAADALAAGCDVHHLLVLDRRSALAGVTCRCDLARGSSESVASVMSSEVFAVEPTTSIGVAATAMKELCIGCLPVVSGPLVIGIVTRHDLERAGVPAAALR